MNDKLKTEARLERSLRRQVTAPRLDGRFDAAVWSRIAAEEQKPAPRLVVRTRMPQWLMFCNALGVAVTVLLVVVAMVRSASGVDLGVDLNLELPRISAEQQSSFIETAGAILSAAAVLFGLMFTSLGRRLRSMLR